MMLSPGERVTLTYPECTLVESLARLRRRRIIVKHIRDLVADPLTPEEFLRRPLVRRSRWLVTGFDQDRQSWRQFYLGSTREFASPGFLRVAVYRPGESQPFDLIGRAFGPSRLERLVLTRAVERWQAAELGRLSLRVLADDFSVMG